MTKSISFSLNGIQASTNSRPDTTVLEWLRGEALLRGTKEGCAEGDCGACSVLVNRPDPANLETGYLAANSCIMLMGQLEGASLVTVEGLAELGDEGHPVQQRMAENGSSQCGFCTPGIVSALSGLLAKNANPDEAEIHDALAGNLCRCTGYRPIVEAAFAAAKNAMPALPASIESDAAETVGNADCSFHNPKTLQALFELKAQHPTATLLAGGTDISLDVAHAKARWDVTISTRHVVELRQIALDDDSISFGGAVTWEEALPHLQKHYPSFATLVRRFGSTQIRSMGTIAGNIGTASPIGDGAPSLLALGASLTLAGPTGERSVFLSEFFTGYRQTVMAEDEIIKSIDLPLPKQDTAFRVYKVSKRYDQDISTVCGAFWIRLTNGKVAEARLAFGGMAATPLRCLKAEHCLLGHSLNDGLENAKAAVKETLAPLSDMRGSADYRIRVAVNLLDRFALELEGETVEVMAL